MISNSSVPLEYDIPTWLRFSCWQIWGNLVLSSPTGKGRERRSGCASECIDFSLWNVKLPVWSDTKGCWALSLQRSSQQLPFSLATQLLTSLQLWGLTMLENQFPPDHEVPGGLQGGRGLSLQVLTPGTNCLNFWLRSNSDFLYIYKSLSNHPTFRPFDR